MSRDVAARKSFTNREWRHRHAICRMAFHFFDRSENFSNGKYVILSDIAGDVYMGLSLTQFSSINPWKQKFIGVEFDQLNDRNCSCKTTINSLSEWSGAVRATRVLNVYCSCAEWRLQLRSRHSNQAQHDDVPASCAAHTQQAERCW